MRTMATLCGLLLIAGLSAGAAENLGLLPPPAEGMVRYVLQLPKQDDESAFRVELIVGKTVQVDEQNRYVFTGRFEQETLDGWAYPCHVVRDLGALVGTKQASHATAPRVNRFVTLGGEPYLVRYNSRIPILVYIPRAAEVRYRLWTAGTEVKTMDRD